LNHIQLIIEMYKNGIGIEKISKVLNLKTSEVYKCLRDNDLLRSNKDQRDIEVCSLYSNGVVITEISRLLNLNRHTVTDILKKHEVYRYDNKRDNIGVEEKRKRNEAIISLYQSGLSMRKVAEQLHICSGTVKNVLDYYGIEKRAQHLPGHSKGTSKNRKHIFDLNYFETIDSEHKAYWLGFLYADGCVHEKGVLTLALQKQDKEHIKKFKNSIGAHTVNLYYSTKTKSYTLNICSVKIVNDLIKLGCIPNKSLVLKFPSFEQVPKYLISHFMRGYFDGDGCIYASERNRHLQTFSVLGTPEFLDEYEKILLEGICRDNSNKRTSRNEWNIKTEQINYSGRLQINKIFQFLYKDATVFLERKYNKFNMLLSSQDEADNNPESIRAELSENHVKS